MQTCTFFSSNPSLSLYEADGLKKLNVDLTDLHRKERGMGYVVISRLLVEQ